MKLFRLSITNSYEVQFRHYFWKFNFQIYQNFQKVPKRKFPKVGPGTIITLFAFDEK